VAVLTSNARSGILPPGNHDANARRADFQGARLFLRKFFGYLVRASVIRAAAVTRIG
jgi:hypothetical protein